MALGYPSCVTFGADVTTCGELTRSSVDSVRSVRTPASHARRSGSVPTERSKASVGAVVTPTAQTGTQTRRAISQKKGDTYRRLEGHHFQRSQCPRKLPARQTLTESVCCVLSLQVGVECVTSSRCRVCMHSGAIEVKIAIWWRIVLNAA